MLRSVWLSSVSLLSNGRSKSICKSSLFIQAQQIVERCASVNRLDRFAKTTFKQDFASSDCGTLIFAVQRNFGKPRNDFWRNLTGKLGNLGNAFRHSPRIPALTFDPWH